MNYNATSSYHNEYQSYDPTFPSNTNGSSVRFGAEAPSLNTADEALIESLLSCDNIETELRLHDQTLYPFLPRTLSETPPVNFPVTTGNVNVSDSLESLGHAQINKNHFTCDLCKASFVKRKLYIAHVQTHMNDDENDEEGEAGNNPSSQGFDIIQISMSSTGENNTITTLSDITPTTDHLISPANTNNVHNTTQDQSSDLLANYISSFQPEINEISDANNTTVDKTSLASTSSIQTNNEEDVQVAQLSDEQISQLAMYDNLVFVDADDVIGEAEKLNDRDVSSEGSNTINSIEFEINKEMQEYKDGSWNTRLNKEKNIQSVEKGKVVIEEDTLKRLINMISKLDSNEAPLQPNDQCEPLLCGYCQIKFSSREQLINHLQEFHSSGTKKSKKLCGLCKQTFPNFRALQDHLFKMHKANHYGLSCAICGLNFSNQAGLSRHFKDHSESTDFPCALCGLLFRGANRLIAHLSTNHPKGISKMFLVSCLVCNKQFVKEDSFQRHLKKCHSIQSKSSPEENPITVIRTGIELQSNVITSSTEMNPKEPYKFQCLKCQIPFVDERQIAKHLLEHRQNSRIQCKKCFKVYDNVETLKKHMSECTCLDRTIKHEDITLTCIVCESTLTERSSARLHILSHIALNFSAESNLFVEQNCPICNVILTEENHTAHIEDHLKHLTRRKELKKSEIKKEENEQDDDGDDYDDDHDDDDELQIKLTCKICKCDFKEQSAARNHVVFHLHVDNSSNTSICPFCDDFVNGKDISKHTDEHVAVLPLRKQTKHGNKIQQGEISKVLKAVGKEQNVHKLPAKTRKPKMSASPRKNDMVDSISDQKLIKSNGEDMSLMERQKQISPSKLSNNELEDIASDVPPEHPNFKLLLLHKTAEVLENQINVVDNIENIDGNTDVTVETIDCTLQRDKLLSKNGKSNEMDGLKTEKAAKPSTLIDFQMLRSEALKIQERKMVAKKNLSEQRTVRRIMCKIVKKIEKKEIEAQNPPIKSVVMVKKNLTLGKNRKKDKTDSVQDQKRKRVTSKVVAKTKPNTTRPTSKHNQPEKDSLDSKDKEIEPNLSLFEEEKNMSVFDETEGAIKNIPNIDNAEEEFQPREEMLHSEIVQLSKEMRKTQIKVFDETEGAINNIPNIDNAEEEFQPREEMLHSEFVQLSKEMLLNEKTQIKDVPCKELEAKLKCSESSFEMHSGENSSYGESDEFVQLSKEMLLNEKTQIKDVPCKELEAKLKCSESSFEMHSGENSSYGESDDGFHQVLTGAQSQANDIPENSTISTIPKNVIVNKDEVIAPSITSLDDCFDKVATGTDIEAQFVSKDNFIPVDGNHNQLIQPSKKHAVGNVSPVSLEDISANKWTQLDSCKVVLEHLNVEDVLNALEGVNDDVQQEYSSHSSHTYPETQNNINECKNILTKDTSTIDQVDSKMDMVSSWVINNQQDDLQNDTTKVMENSSIEQTLPDTTSVLKKKKKKKIKSERTVEIQPTTMNFNSTKDNQDRVKKRKMSDTTNIVPPVDLNYSFLGKHKQTLCKPFKIPKLSEEEKQQRDQNGGKPLPIKPLDFMRPQQSFKIPKKSNTTTTDLSDNESMLDIDEIENVFPEFLDDEMVNGDIAQVDSNDSKYEMKENKQVKVDDKSFLESDAHDPETLEPIADKKNITTFTKDSIIPKLGQTNKESSETTVSTSKEEVSLEKSLNTVVEETIVEKTSLVTPSIRECSPNASEFIEKPAISKTIPQQSTASLDIIQSKPVSTEEFIYSKPEEQLKEDTLVSKKHTADVDATSQETELSSQKKSAVDTPTIDDIPVKETTTEEHETIKNIQAKPKISLFKKGGSFFANLSSAYMRTRKNAKPLKSIKLKGKTIEPKSKNIIDNTSSQIKPIVVTEPDMLQNKELVEVKDSVDKEVSEEKSVISVLPDTTALKNTTKINNDCAIPSDLLITCKRDLIQEEDNHQTDLKTDIREEISKDSEEHLVKCSSETLNIFASTKTCETDLSTSKNAIGSTEPDLVMDSSRGNSLFKTTRNLSNTSLSTSTHSTDETLSHETDTNTIGEVISKPIPEESKPTRKESSSVIADESLVAVKSPQHEEKQIGKDKLIASNHLKQSTKQSFDDLSSDNLLKKSPKHRKTMVVDEFSLNNTLPLTQVESYRVSTCNSCASNEPPVNNNPLSVPNKTEKINSSNVCDKTENHNSLSKPNETKDIDSSSESNETENNDSSSVYNKTENVNISREFDETENVNISRKSDKTENIDSSNISNDTGNINSLSISDKTETDHSLSVPSEAKPNHTTNTSNETKGSTSESNQSESINSPSVYEETENRSTKITENIKSLGDPDLLRPSISEPVNSNTCMSANIAKSAESINSKVSIPSVQSLKIRIDLEKLKSRPSRSCRSTCRRPRIYDEQPMKLVIKVPLKSVSIKSLSSSKQQQTFNRWYTDKQKLYDQFQLKECFVVISPIKNHEQNKITNTQCTNRTRKRTGQITKETMINTDSNEQQTLASSHIGRNQRRKRRRLKDDQDLEWEPPVKI